MKKFRILLAIISVNLALPTFSQEIDYNFDSKEIQSIMAGTVYILPTGNKIFDDSLKLAVEKFWKVSKFQFLTAAEADQYLKDENNFFLAPVNALGNTGTGGGKSKVVSPMESDEYRTLFVFHGGKHSKITNIDYQDSMGECELVFWSKKNAANGLGYVVKNLNDNIEIVSSKKLKSKGFSVRWNPAIYAEYSKNAGLLKNKILLIDKNTSDYLKEKVLATYKYEYKILDTPELISLLNSDPKKYCLLSANVGYTGYVDIFDAETKSHVYSGVRNGGGLGKVSEKQIAALNTAINK